MDSAPRNRAVVAWVLGILAVPAAGALIASFLWSPEAVASGAPMLALGLDPYVCPGCPSCGLSRAFSAMSHLRAGEAIDFNPGVLLGYPLAWLIAGLGPTLLLRELWLRRTTSRPLRSSY